MSCMNLLIILSSLALSLSEPTKITNLVDILQKEEKSFKYDDVKEYFDSLKDLPNLPKEPTFISGRCFNSKYPRKIYPGLLEILVDAKNTLKNYKIYSIDSIEATSRHFDYYSFDEINDLISESHPDRHEEYPEIESDLNSYTINLDVEYLTLKGVKSGKIILTENSFIDKKEDDKTYFCVFFNFLI